MDLRSNTVVSVMEIAKLLGPGSAEAAALGGDGHKHPHDAIFLPNGDVVVGTWNPGHLSYWRCEDPPLPASSRPLVLLLLLLWPLLLMMLMMMMLLHFASSTLPCLLRRRV